MPTDRADRPLAVRALRVLARYAPEDLPRRACPLGEVRQILSLEAMVSETVNDSSDAIASTGLFYYGFHVIDGIGILPLSQGLGIGYLGSVGVDIMQVLWDAEVVVLAFALPVPMVAVAALLRRRWRDRNTLALGVVLGILAGCPWPIGSAFRTIETARGATSSRSCTASTGRSCAGSSCAGPVIRISPRTWRRRRSSRRPGHCPAGGGGERGGVAAHDRA